MTDEPLPSIVPVFPLQGVLLLPRAPLPLHIFEPRYRAMTRDALAGDGFIAMVQPAAEAGDPANPPLFSVGCLGKIVASEEMDDGRYNIVLCGHMRLRIVQELSLKDGYRRVEADYAEFRSDATPGDDTIDRDTLFGAMEAYLERRNMQANWGDAQKASDEALVNALAAACPLEPEEKQALLEAPTLTDRAQLLIGLCQLGATGHPGGSAIKH